MKVQVVKATPDKWYYSSIGKVFDVYKQGEGYWVVNEKQPNNPTKYILKDDVIPEIVPFKFKIGDKVRFKRDFNEFSLGIRSFGYIPDIDLVVSGKHLGGWLDANHEEKMLNSYSFENLHYILPETALEKSQENITMKEVVLEKNEDQIITAVDLMKKGACQSSLYWLLENHDKSKWTKKELKEFLNSHNRDDDTNWLFKNFPDTTGDTILVDDIDKNKWFGHMYSGSVKGFIISDSYSDSTTYSRYHVISVHSCVVHGFSALALNIKEALKLFKQDSKVTIYQFDKERELTNWLLEGK